jgi:hypothetical protein
MLRGYRLLAFLVTALCGIGAIGTSPAAAQTLAGEVPQVGAASTTFESEPYLDRKMAGSSDRLRAAWARFREQNFTAYLGLVSAVAGVVLGGMFALFAYRFSDPMSPYRTIRRNAALLSLASGAGLGVLLAVLQVPPNLPGRVTLLLLAVGSGAIAAGLSAFLGFVLHRLCSSLKARRLGIQLGHRMRHG